MGKKRDHPDDQSDDKERPERRLQVKLQDIEDKTGFVHRGELIFGTPQSSSQQAPTVFETSFASGSSSHVETPTSRRRRTPTPDAPPARQRRRISSSTISPSPLDSLPDDWQSPTTEFSLQTNWIDRERRSSGPGGSAAGPSFHFLPPLRTPPAFPLGISDSYSNGFEPSMLRSTAATSPVYSPSGYNGDPRTSTQGQRTFELRDGTECSTGAHSHAFDQRLSETRRGAYTMTRSDNVISHSNRRPRRERRPRGGLRARDPAASAIDAPQAQTSTTRTDPLWNYPTNLLLRDHRSTPPIHEALFGDNRLHASAHTELYGMPNHTGSFPLLSHSPHPRNRVLPASYLTGFPSPATHHTTAGPRVPLIQDTSLSTYPILYPPSPPLPGLQPHSVSDVGGRPPNTGTLLPAGVPFTAARPFLNDIGSISHVTHHAQGPDSYSSLQTFASTPPPELQSIQTAYDAYAAFQRQQAQYAFSLGLVPADDDYWWRWLPLSASSPGGFASEAPRQQLPVRTRQANIQDDVVHTPAQGKPSSVISRSPRDHQPA